jgi:hypothetical protein
MLFTISPLRVTDGIPYLRLGIHLLRKNNKSAKTTAKSTGKKTIEPSISERTGLTITFKNCECVIQSFFGAYYYSVRRRWLWHGVVKSWEN